MGREAYILPLEKQFTKAIAEGDGVAAAEAQRVMNDASNKYNQLTNLKATHDTNRRNSEVEKNVTPQQQKDNGLKHIYMQRFFAQNDWFDPAGRDEDSKTAKEIDDEVNRDGFDPNTKEYWDELKSRLKEEIPHVFGEKRAVRSDSGKPRPKQVNGSMGADSGSTTTKTLKIPSRVVKMAKDAGYWDDPKMRKVFIKNWKTQNETTV
jgi:hypothetical protein